MLVNDMGPEWDRLERGILDSIKGYDHFLYKRNECNIGFVKTLQKPPLHCYSTESKEMLHYYSLGRPLLSPHPYAKSFPFPQETPPSLLYQRSGARYGIW